MALVYPGSAAIPQYQNALASFMPAFEAGQKDRKDSDAFDAAAKAFGGKGAPAKEPSFLERLAAPFTRPQPAPTATAAINAAVPQTPRPFNGMDVSTPTSATTSIAPEYILNARRAESGGNDNAANPRSSALGRYQFLESTWNGLANQYPELGLTADGRTDPAQQERAMARFTQDNATALAQAGVPVDPGSLYAAHFLGAGGATKALTADPSTPMTALVDPGVISANPQLQGMTAGDFAQWAQGKGGNQSGGYQPPMRDEGAGQGQPFQPDEATMRTLLASEATRPLAMSLIQAQQETQASQGRFVTEQGPGGSIWQRDTLTGEKKVLQEANAGLPSGYQRGADGGLMPIPGGPADPNNPLNGAKAAPDAPDVVTRYNAETGQEEKVVWNPSTGQFDPFGGQKAPSNGMTITTNPDGTTTVTQGGSGKPLTEANGKDVFFYTQGEGALPIVDQMGDVLTNLGQNVGGNVPVIGNYLKSTEYQQAEQAGNAFLNAILRKESGAAITPDEKANYGDVYLPRPGDKPEVLAQKKAARARALLGIKLGLPPAGILALENGGINTNPGSTPNTQLPPISAPPQSAPVTITDDAGFDALPSGAHFIGPDGQERVKP